jgi:dienelactone hydrolase
LAVIHAWYPTTSRGPALRLEEYAGSAAPQLAAFLQRAGISKPTVDSIMGAALYASATPATSGSKYPLVLVAQGNAHDVVDQVILCEYLASLGFVVVSTPSPMLRTPMQREDQVGEIAEQQASELDDAMAVAVKELPVDPDRVGIAGHSFGARAALLLVMRKPEIRALVSLDGGIGTATAADPFRRARSFNAAAQLPPVLHFYEEMDAFMAPDFTLLKGLRIAELDTVRTSDLRHTHFTTYGFLAGMFADITRVTRATPATGASIASVAVRTGEFLKIRLR